MKIQSHLKLRTLLLSNYQCNRDKILLETKKPFEIYEYEYILSEKMGSGEFTCIPNTRTLNEKGI